MLPHYEPTITTDEEIRTMAKMTRRMKELFEKLEVVVLGTSTPNGIPNTVPIGAKKIIDDETVLISDQFLNKTLANINSNPKVSVTYWEGNEGYQLKGTVSIETAGPRCRQTTRIVFFSLFVQTWHPGRFIPPAGFFNRQGTTRSVHTARPGDPLQMPWHCPHHPGWGGRSSV